MHVLFLLQTVGHHKRYVASPAGEGQTSPGFSQHEEAYITFRLAVAQLAYVPGWEAKSKDIF